MPRVSKQDIPPLVDRAGALKAQIAELEDELDAIKGKLYKRFGAGTYEGELFHLVLVKVQTSTLSASKARQYLTPKEIQDCTNESESLQMRVYARKRDG